MLAAEPGQPFDPDEIPWALDTIRQAFSAEGRWLSAELVDEANPGLAEALEASGMTIVSHPPLLVVEPDGLTFPELTAGVTTEVVKSEEQQAEAKRRVRGGLRGRRRRFRAQAGSRGRRLRPGPRRRSSGCLRFLDRGRRRRHRGRGGRDRPLHSHRRRGLGGLATAYATQQAFELAGATLAWFTPGDDGADRVYRRLGYEAKATAVHLGDPGGHLADLR